MRRAFILNSAVLILLIPVLLLIATYEDVTSFIVTSQSERIQLKKTTNLVDFLNLDFQRALEISGKRAVVAVVDYISLTGNFISPTYKSNNTIADLIRRGNSPSITGYDPNRIMQGQTIESWLSNISKLLNKQGYRLSPSIQDIAKKTEIKVTPLDAFRIAIKARIPNITIMDKAGKIVYSGPIPSDNSYVYSIVDITELEDPLFSAMTGGRYHRSIKACNYALPEFGQRPITFANGSGESTEPVILGRYGESLLYNSTHIWDENGNYATNFTINGIRIPTSEIIKNNGDVGVLNFVNISTFQGYIWCSGLEYRVNITIKNNVGKDLTDYQIPIIISTSKLPANIVNFIFQNTNYTGNTDVFKNGASIAIYDSNCNRIPFWIEYWDPQNERALIWIRDSIQNGQSKTYSLYFGEGTPTKGNGNDVFLFFDDFENPTLSQSKWIKVDRRLQISNGELYIPGGDEVFAIRTRNPIDYSGLFAIRFRMKGRFDGDLDSGIGIEDNEGNIILFTDDSAGGDGLAIHSPWWRDTSEIDGRSDITSYHTYEAIVYNIYSGISNSYIDVKFKDIIDGRSNSDFWWSFTPPLKYVYIVIDSERWQRGAYFDYILVRKYPGNSLEDPDFLGIRLSSSGIEEKPTISEKISSDVHIYDIQPFIDCLLGQRYFAIRNGWSFFERLEGSNQNHRIYERLANQTQDELGITYHGEHYPIGLVSFMIPHGIYDRKLLNLMTEIQKSPNEEMVSSADYYFLTYYFGNGNKVEGYRVWGISYGVIPEGDLSNIPFFLDPETAKAILGEQGACDLLYGYNCG
ncbi:DUF2341 domain-containing protein [Pyrococcus abyssi]|uniref:DUF2341 domain-containing protein n=1 Tax=Pyrococcus abyssi (strain GE5 / Orsay) TaxID=272844 RepID=Q9V0I2_PYRAB|nr:DUF2341 domain-containing protein [Pyrococcus abyssi]CAB49721.1 Hypothetical protein PAB1827 [Pyrococcus abyssi GE5]CCE70208.1 TPA: hypothetical protein PAB1827 [Pyrococcus abyssi GE5]